MYSDEFMIAFGCFIRSVLVLIPMPVMIWVLIYRKIKGKKNIFLLNWIFNET
jgi:hypothetical protein